MDNPTKGQPSPDASLLKHNGPTLPLRKYVHDLQTGRVITSRPLGSYDSMNQWAWISNAVADWHDCDVADVDCIETDEGEFITVKGERAAIIEVN